ncbi:NTpase [Cetacean poxvirus 1]|nr:NTpase [Cetacean poxvirus 1]
MTPAIDNNDIIFVLKSMRVTSECRQSEDKRFVEAFTCEELETYISKNMGCTLFETLRDEEAYSVVRIFFDVDLDGILDGINFITAFKDFIIETSNVIAQFATKYCNSNYNKIIKCMRTNFSVTKSTNQERTSFHVVFQDTYTTLETLIAMKKYLLDLSKNTNNPLIRSIDTAVYRHKTTLRIVGTQKSIDDNHIHIKQPPYNNISDYLFTYVRINDNSCYFTLNENNIQDSLNNNTLWEPVFISFNEAMSKLSQVIINKIINYDELNENNFVGTPIIIDYVLPCALCKKVSHKHPHYMSVCNKSLRIYKSGNPNSCKVKVIMLEGNKLFTIAQQIINNNMIHLTERGDYIVWIRNSWRFNADESLITKLVLDMKDVLPVEYGPCLLCPRKRKVVESNLKDMLVDKKETDIYPDKLPFNNGILDLSNNSFKLGNDAKKYICTISTGFNYMEKDDSSKMKELEQIINDIQPDTSENKENRILYEKVLSSCLCGITKQCVVFFYGETATGKSTTKRLLHSAIGNLFLETGQTILTDVMDKGPNPFISNMHLKRSVFCSELPDFACNNAKKIRADNIKKLTEPNIVGRPCFSNRINNRNHATIIIDTNYKPVFDRVDNALMRRVSLVKFRTHFSYPDRKVAAENNVAYDTVKLLDENLDIKIQQNYFRFSFLKLLVKWYHQYHIPNVKINPTPEAVPDFIFQLKISTLIIASSSVHVPLMNYLIKKGYSLINDCVSLPINIFKEKISTHFNVRLYGHDIESFIMRNKKFANICEEYLEYIFIEDITSK